MDVWKCRLTYFIANNFHIKTFMMYSEAVWPFY